MSKIAAHITLGAISLNKSAETPLRRQLYENLRGAILEGQLRSGVRVPSTRALAKELGISRNTVCSAYTQLLTEGYLESCVGAGTHVTRTLPEALSTVQQPLTSPAQDDLDQPPRLSRRGDAILGLSRTWEHNRVQPFDSSLPALDQFPFKLWEKLMVASWRDLKVRELAYQSALGYLPLREALVTYLQAARGVRCSAEQIIITNGAQQAITLTANVILNAGDSAWVENPCYPGIRAALQGVRARIVPVRVDAEGLDVDAGISADPTARLSYISPSHQYPLGVTMSLTRRVKLLEWAQAQRSWIIEDDYDSEFRYAGYPLASVQGLDRVGRVIYVGTFSKVLFPALRIGYMVVPKRLVSAFHAARAYADRGAPLLEQAVLARFISEGHLARHVRRMRTTYIERQAILVEMVQKFLRGLLTVKPTDAGLHLVGWLPAGADDQAVSNKLAEYGITAPALSSFALTPFKRSGLVLGFAATPTNEIPMAVKRMWGVLEMCLR